MNTLHSRSIKQCSSQFTLAKKQTYICSNHSLQSTRNTLNSISPRRHVSSMKLPTSQPSAGNNSTSTKAVKPTVLQSVGRATVTGSYFVFVSAGCALLGIVFWALGSNLFYETRYFGEAVTMIKNDPEIKKSVAITRCLD